MKQVTTFSGISETGSYIYNNVAVTISEITDNGRLRGIFVIDGKEIKFSNSPSGLKSRIDNGGKNPTFGNKAESTGAGSFEKLFLKLQQAMYDAEAAFVAFQESNLIFSVEDAREADKAKAAAKAAEKAAEKAKAEQRAAFEKTLAAAEASGNKELADSIRRMIAEM